MKVINQINWNKIWEEKMNASSGVASWSRNGAGRGIKRWDDIKLRPIRTGDEEYANKLINKIHLDTKDSVLDIGCGSGILSIPIAKMVKSVTALDVSAETLEELKEKAIKGNVRNIEYMQGNWQFLSPGVDIPVHDIVIASRCLGMFDLREELLKINSSAEKHAFITRVVEEKDHFSPKVYELMGRKFQPLPNYYYIYNLLYQLGIKAKIEYILADIEEKYDCIGDAVNVWKWKLHEITEDEELKLKIFLKNNLIYSDDSKLSTGKFSCTWALISWSPKKEVIFIAGKKEQKKTEVPNWESALNEVAKQSPTDEIKDIDYTKWDSFAKHFNQGVLKDWANQKSYINQLVNMIEGDHQDTVLDIGCGSGGISIPLAKKFKNVTAIDTSPEMISYLKSNAQSYNIDNINLINNNWDDIVIQSDFPKHDIIIASRCLSGFNLKERLIKINSIASKRVYFSWVIKIGEQQKSVYMALKRKMKQEPEYIYIFNLLHSIGINPEIDFIYSDSQKCFSSIEEAVDYYGWIIKNITEKEKKMLRLYFEHNYVNKKDKKIILQPNLHSKWAWVVFKWEKKDE